MDTTKNKTIEIFLFIIWTIRVMVNSIRKDCTKEYHYFFCASSFNVNNSFANFLFFAECEIFYVSGILFSFDWR